eukprot:TRINITY_DN74690_c0_g1_i1.p1 TRINITY_DN74690_c0_g1~~TRINITY_DN74690_c0_g1_i1.p1  ORF type:complete len:996 (-),score=189.33 TRINITY_DN74690_c0_g1_i1:106-3093(-)
MAGLPPGAGQHRKLTIWRACARIWAGLPPQAVKPGDRVEVAVMRLAVEGALGLLNSETATVAVGKAFVPPTPEWTFAAIGRCDKGGTGLVGYDSFVSIVDEYCELLALAGADPAGRIATESGGRPRLVSDHAERAPQPQEVRKAGDAASGYRAAQPPPAAHAATSTAARPLAVSNTVPVAQTAGNGVSAAVERVEWVMETEQPQKPRLEARVEQLCRQAFGLVNPDASDLLDASQAKTALHVVFTGAKAPLPPDVWYDAVFQNYTENGCSPEAGILDFEDLVDIALQHCEVHCQAGASPVAAAVTDQEQQSAATHTRTAASPTQALAKDASPSTAAPKPATTAASAFHQPDATKREAVPPGGTPDHHAGDDGGCVRRKRTTFAACLVEEVEVIRAIAESSKPGSLQSQTPGSNSSCVSEWWDPHAPGSRRSSMASGMEKTLSQRSDANAVVGDDTGRSRSQSFFRRRSTRFGSVPIASHVMTPAYSGQLRVFDDYNFLESKGGGAFGQVVRVQHKSTGLLRACKSITLRGGRRQMQLVETETALMRKLDHPTVLRLFESYYDGDRNIYLIIELCEGGDLAKRIQKARDEGILVQEGPAAWAMRDALAALDYCHRRGVIHRDIKPDNLLYVDKTPDSRLKVIDFGLSDFLSKIDNRPSAASSPGAQAARKSQAQGPKIGTPHFMAPEIYLEGIYDAKVDTFACGVVLAEVLTGVHPFFTLGIDNLDTIREKIIRGNINYSAPHWQRAPALGMDLVRGLLVTDRNKRLDAATALAHQWPQTAGTRRRKTMRMRGNETLSKTIFSSLAEFREYNVLQQAALRVMARQLDDEQLAGLQQQFQLVDTDGSGAISEQELMEAAKKLNVGLSPADARDIMTTFDRMMGGSTEVAYSDFLASMLLFDVQPTKQQLQYVFQRFCDATSSLITAESLQRALMATGGMTASSGPMAYVPASNAGADVTHDDMKQVFEDLAEGKDYVDFHAFCSMWPGNVEDAPVGI